MKLEKNDTTKTSGIRLAIDWLRGMKMHIPNSKWVMFTIGIYVLAAAFEKAFPSLGALIMMLH